MEQRPLVTRRTEPLLLFGSSSGLNPVIPTRYRNRHPELQTNFKRFLVLNRSVCASVPEDRFTCRRSPVVAMPG
ncbi:hypothetical protein ABVT39_002642 [Epinephelus coioides]